MEISTTLCLKRTREDFEEQEKGANSLQELVVFRQAKSRKEVGSSGMQEEMGIVQENMQHLKAEEAGQSMPP